jgi:hypothetical protein
VMTSMIVIMTTSETIMAPTWQHRV